MGTHLIWKTYKLASKCPTMLNRIILYYGFPTNKRRVAMLCNDILVCKNSQYGNIQAVSIKNCAIKNCLSWDQMASQAKTYSNMTSKKL